VCFYASFWLCKILFKQKMWLKKCVILILF
jgi:hypothetical protein